MKTVALLAPLVVVTLILLGMSGTSPATAQGDPLVSRLQQLPVSAGDNHEVTVQRGEYWVQIGIRERVGYEQLHRANPRGFSSGRILIPGRYVVAQSVETGIVINIPELALYYFRDGRVLQRYPLSVGMVQPRWHTITGNFTVASKVVNPVWYRPAYAGGGSTPPGPDNPLGDRLINLNVPYYGLHSTNNPSTIGRMISHGCMRMFPPHMRELFKLVAVGNPLVITYETVKIGYDGGVVYLAVYPDIYNKRTNSAARVRARLGEYELSEAVNDTELQSRLRQADGVARPLLGSTMPVYINGTRWDGPIGPTMRSGSSYLPLTSLAQAISAETTWDPSTGRATATYQGKTVTFAVNGRSAFSALGAPFVPVRTFVETLGGAVTGTGGAIRITMR